MVPDTFGGYIIYFDRVQPIDLEIYLECIRQSAPQQVEKDLWESLYVEGATHPTQIRWSAYHFARTCSVVHKEMMRLVLSNTDFQEIELRAILKKPEPVPVSPEVPEQVVPDVVVPKPQPVVHEPVIEAEADVELTVIAPVVVPEIEDEDIDEDEELEMDPEEPEHMVEDIDAVTPGQAPTADITQIAAIWATEMASQPEGFEIREEELVKAIVVAEAFVAIVETIDDELEEDIAVTEAADDELDEDDEDDDALMDDDEEIATDLPEEIFLGPMMTFHPMSLIRLSFQKVTDRTCCPLLRFSLIATDRSLLCKQQKHQQFLVYYVSLHVLRGTQFD